MNDKIKHLLTKLTEITPYTQETLNMDAKVVNDMIMAENEYLMARNETLEHQVNIFRGIFEDLPFCTTKKAEFISNKVKELKQIKLCEDIYYA